MITQEEVDEFYLKSEKFADEIFTFLEKSNHSHGIQGKALCRVLICHIVAMEEMREGLGYAAFKQLYEQIYNALNGLK